MIAAAPVSLLGVVWTVIVVVWCAALFRPVQAGLDALKGRLDGLRDAGAGRSTAPGPHQQHHAVSPVLWDWADDPEVAA